MCLAGRVLALSAVALWFTGCDTDQPSGRGQATATLEFHVEAGAVPTAVVYPSLRVDTNGDGVPDDVISAINERAAPPICEVNNDVTVVAPLPWGIGLEVTVVKAGTTDPVVIQSTQTGTGAFAFSVVSRYDLSGTPLPDRPLADPTPVSGGRVAYAHTDGTQTHTASAVYLMACAGLQPDDLPEYRDTTFPIERGDLIRVMARRVPDSSSQPFFPRFSIPLLVDGVPVEVDGTNTVDSPENGIAFTYLFN